MISKFFYCHFQKKKNVNKVITACRDRMWSGNNVIIQTKLKLSGEVFLPWLHQLDQLDIFVVIIRCGPQLSAINTSGRRNSYHFMFEMNCFLLHSHQIHLGKMWLELLCQLSHLLQKSVICSPSVTWSKATLRMCSYWGQCFYEGVP